MTRITIRRLAPAVAIVGALAFAACGDDADTTAATSAEADDTSAPAGTADETTAPADETVVTGDPAPSSSTDQTDDVGDGETYEAGAYVEAVVVEIDADDEDTATCVAQSVVDAIGVERIEASGVSPDDFAAASTLGDVDLAIDEANAPTMQSDLEACGDLIGLFANAGDASDEQLACVRDNLTDPLIAELFVAQFVGIAPSAEVAAASEAVQECAAD